MIYENIAKVTGIFMATLYCNMQYWFTNWRSPIVYYLEARDYIIFFMWSASRIFSEVWLMEIGSIYVYLFDGAWALKNILNWNSNSKPWEIYLEKVFWMTININCLLFIKFHFLWPTEQIFYLIVFSLKPEEMLHLLWSWKELECS